MKNYFIGLAICLCSFGVFSQVKKCYYVTWDGTNELLCSTDLISRISDTVGIISGVNTLVNSTSAFDNDSGHYIFQSNFGVTVVDVEDARIVDTFNLPNFDYHLFEYNKLDKKCYYITWDGADELLCSMDLVSGNNDTVGTISGVNSVVNNTSTFDSDSGYYIFQSNLGITVVNTNDASIVDTFKLPISSYSLLEYDIKTKKCYYVTWDGINELLCSTHLTSGVNDTVGIISGVNSVANNTSTFNSEDGYYIFRSNLGITVVNTTNATVVSSISLPITSYSLLEYDKYNVVGIKDRKIKSPESFMLYPNPTSGYFSIELGGSAKSMDEFIIRISDVNGRLIQSKKYKNRKLIDVSNRPEGIYLVDVQFNNQRTVFKLIKSRVID